MGCCGFRCGQCPAYLATKANDKEGLARCSAEWERLFGLHLSVDQLWCDGCYRELGRKAVPNCPVRPCCLSRGFITCAECADYPCSLLQERFVSRNDIESRLGYEIPEEIYQRYMRPLENKGRLDEIHKRYGAGGKEP